MIIVPTDNETMIMKQSIPQALSKPVHLHNIVCSSTELYLLECSFSKYTGNINDVQDVIITCKQRKLSKLSTIM